MKLFVKLQFIFCSITCVDICKVVQDQILQNWSKLHIRQNQLEPPVDNYTTTLLVLSLSIAQTDLNSSFRYCFFLGGMKI